MSVVGDPVGSVFSALLTLLILCGYIYARMKSKKPNPIDILISRFFLAGSLVVAINLIWYYLTKDYLLVELTYE